MCRSTVLTLARDASSAALQVGIFVADMHPGHYIDEGTYALLGAASFLGGAMRMTVRHGSGDLDGGAVSAWAGGWARF